MISIEPQAWAAMLAHAKAAYPKECCGMLVGSADGRVTEAVACENVYEGDQRDRFQIRTDDILRVQREAHTGGRHLIGFFHSHPDAEAYFSKTDLANASPWHAHVVLSLQRGEFAGAKAYRVDLDL
ncbi:MAG: M67 family metallopeptidase, partial [Bryobacterales bacterium]|nr:M67 family metallopeptidase [Bryobacterales bacterium]